MQYYTFFLLVSLTWTTIAWNAFHSHPVRLKRTLVARSAAQNTFNMLADDSTSSKPAVPSQGYDLNGSNRIYEPGVDGPDLEEFCMVDEKTGKKILLTREEKERIFLDSVQTYYTTGKGIMSDKQFDRLREDLSWEGSRMVVMNRNETLFMNAMAAYEKGAPILSDAEFDELKSFLKESNSPIAVATEPKSFMDTGVSKVTWLPDNIRTFSLYVPAAIFFTILYLELVYEIPFVKDFFKPLLLLTFGAYPIYLGSKKVTENFLFKDPYVAGGPCPKCGVWNKVFFGDVLQEEGANDECTIKCVNCKSALTIKRETLRVSTILADKAAAKGSPAPATGRTPVRPAPASESNDSED